VIEQLIMKITYCCWWAAPQVCTIGTDLLAHKILLINFGGIRLKKIFFQNFFQSMLWIPSTQYCSRTS